MALSPEILDLVFGLLSNSPDLNGMKEWNEANSLVTLATPGGSTGIEKETFEPYDLDMDEAVAYINIVLWTKNADQVAGEAEVRLLAQTVRKVLIKNRNLGGAAADSFVHGISYATANGGKSILLHLAELDYRVTYYADRFTEDDADAPVVDTVNFSIENY